MLITLIFAVEAVLGAVLTVCLTSLHPLWGILIAIGYDLALDALYLLVLLLSSLCLGKREPDHDSPVCRLITVKTIQWILVTLRIPVTLEGRELLPEEPVILVSNHRSDFDPMVAMAAMPDRRIAYVSKPSNLSIPIAGNYVRRCSFLPIDRENPRAALRTMCRAATILKERGLDIGIYPEGTRSRTGGLKPYKEGAFFTAKRAAAPIAVMVTEGTERIAGRAIIHRNPVRLRIVGVIPREDVAHLSIQELTLRAEQMTREALGEA